MIRKIEESVSETVFINIFNVDRKVSSEDVKATFNTEVFTTNQDGNYHLKFMKKVDAVSFINMVNSDPKVINRRLKSSI